MQLKSEILGFVSFENPYMAIQGQFKWGLYIPQGFSPNNSSMGELNFTHNMGWGVNLQLIVHSPCP